MASGKAGAGTWSGRDVLPGPKKPTWACACGADGNWACRVRCRGCSKAAPQRIRQAAEKEAKAQQAGEKPARASGGRPPAARPVGQPNVQTLMRMVSALQRQLAGGGLPPAAEPQPPGAAAAGPAAMEEEEEDERKTSLKKDWKLAAARAAHLRATPELLRDEGFEDKLAQADAAAKAAEDLYRAHGTSERQRSAYLLREDQRAAKAAEAANQEAEDKKAEVKRLEEVLAAAKAAAAAAEAEATKAAAAAAAASAARLAHAAQLATRPADGAAAASMPAFPGYVSIAFAEERWAEREAEFAASIAQLRALLPDPAESAASDAASEGGDVVVGDLEDDEAWSKVGKGKRKAVLHRERNVLAKHVRAGLSKASTVHSPFRKASG